MEEDTNYDRSPWNSDFVTIVGFVNNYDPSADIVRTQKFLERVFKGESLDTLVTAMTEQQIDPFAVYFNQCTFHEAYHEGYVHGDIPLDAKVIVTQGLHSMLREADDNRNATTALVGAVMIPFSFLSAFCTGSPLEGVLVALSGPAMTAGAYALFKAAQYFTMSGKSKAFVAYLEKSYDLTSSVNVHDTTDSDHFSHDLTRNISRRRYLAGDDVKFYPSWCYSARQEERYTITENGLNGEQPVYGLAVTIENGFLPALTFGKFLSGNTIGEGKSVELAKMERDIPIVFPTPLFVPRQDYEKFQAHVQRYVTLLAA